MPRHATVVTKVLELSDDAGESAMPECPQYDSGSSARGIIPKHPPFPRTCFIAAQDRIVASYDTDNPTTAPPKRYIGDQSGTKMVTTSDMSVSPHNPPSSPPLDHNSCVRSGISDGPPEILAILSWRTGSPPRLERQLPDYRCPPLLILRCRNSIGNLLPEHEGTSFQNSIPE